MIEKDINGDFFIPENYIYKSQKGLNEEIVKNISFRKQEPVWMLQYRLESLKCFEDRLLPDWGPSKLKNLDPNDIYYYVKPVEKTSANWNEVPEDIKNTFDRLGVSESEKKYLAGLSTQFESENVYHKLRKEWTEKGVIFLDTDTALKKYPKLFKKYFGSVIPKNDNKFAALNSAVWSGGSFVYVPKGVHITMPLQMYFRINSKQMGQFERTLIIADEGSFVHYIEGCTAPIYNRNSLHSAVVEIIAKKDARVRYTTIQNWSRDVYNLVTKRAVAHENALVEWVDGNLGSGITMKYPCVVLKGTGARADILSIAMATSEKQIQDSGGKAIHLASDTSSKIVSKSISKDGGRCSYRGVVKVPNGMKNCKSFVQCDALILDNKSCSDTYPYIDIAESNVDIGHEARVNKVGEEQIFYLMSRGISEQDALSMIVNGFVEPFVKELPMEFAIEMNRLIEMEMEGSIG
ncbi:Fe-S cluster assembly protein SufB [Candidatus Babeliales bacterium]|nr:Fe-S cluster assembly protein SufB [Candidatus Babeliales bacterium]